MSKFSVKKPFTVLVAVVFVLILGAVSFTRMTTDLLPEFSLPYVVVVTTYPGASPDKIESTVTEPLESGLGTVNGVLNVTSTSNENYCTVMLEFEENTNMDSAMVKLSSALDLITLPEGTGKPMIMEISMDMLPVMYVSVDYEGKDIYELSDFVEETIVPQMERQNGVASVNTTGLLEKSVEIRLNEDKINALNDQLAAHVNAKLADAKAEIDQANAQLRDARNQLETAQKSLEEQQKETSDQLAKSSQLVDQAVATQSAFNAQLSGLQASKSALEMEKKAYEDAGLGELYERLNGRLDELQALEEELEQEIGTFPRNVRDAIENPQKIEALRNFIEEHREELPEMPQLQDIDPEELLANLDIESLRQLYSAIQRMSQIDTELANLNTEIAAAQAVSDQVNSQVDEAVQNYSALESGKIQAAAGFASGQAQIFDGLAAIESSEVQVKQAQEAYENGRDTALKSANLDALLSMDTLSGLIYAQNFSMPAGYIYESEDQYLLKVGDEFTSEEDLANALLVNIDGLGDVRLSDVADVTWIDNSGDAYAKVNGNEGIVVTISKGSTAGTSEVSDTCNEEIQRLQEEYEGLRITSLMDQGEYIDLIVKNVLQNLIVGAVLAVIVLAIFLRSVKPTLVVAFSIPISVLVAVVLMYFSGITLNIISLSGLALGIGMLVDNSIVVLENIYRLRGLGIPSARAAVMGARQVAGAIAASTLTTICVFLPIVFTNGLIRELFVDMALTITYSLVASLLIALTVVPAMISTVLRKAQPKEQKLLNRLLDVYEKVLRFSLKRKAVPIAIAVGLLAVCAWKAVNTGLILLPSMGGEQMSVTMKVNPELSDEEAFAIADDAMAKMSAVEGVDYVGIISGSKNADASASSMLLSTGGTHDLNVYILTDKETSKDNSVVAEQLEEICKKLDLEDYSVSTSNMDFSAYLDSGLSVNVYGPETEGLLAVSEDVVKMVDEIEGFTNAGNGQEDGDETIELTISKDDAMRAGITVAQVVQELSGNLTTEKTATTLTIDGKQYEVDLINENDSVDVDSLLDYTFEVQKTDSEGQQFTETHRLGEFATMSRGRSLETIQRDNQKNYVTVTAETQDGYNTTLLSRQLQEKLDAYEAPDGYTIEMAGEIEQIRDAVSSMILMLCLGIAFIYLIMVGQFQSILSPFIVLFTIPLAFTGGFIGIFISGEEISLTSMMGFLMLAGVVVNNGIVFVDYTNQLRLDGKEKREALVETGRDRMRPILMTMLTTVLAMSTMIFSTDAAAAMSRGMAVVVIGGLLYATLMTLFIVPVLYDLLFRRELKRVDVGTEKELREDI